MNACRRVCVCVCVCVCTRAGAVVLMQGKAAPFGHAKSLNQWTNEQSNDGVLLHLSKCALEAEANPGMPCKFQFLIPPPQSMK